MRICEEGWIRIARISSMLLIDVMFVVYYTRLIEPVAGLAAVYHHDSPNARVERRRVVNNTPTGIPPWLRLWYRSA